MHLIGYTVKICVQKFALCMIYMLWHVLKGFFSMIGCLLNIRQWKVGGGWDCCPGAPPLLHIISFGTSISIPWDWKHQVHVDKPTCSWLNLDVLLLSWILPPGRIWMKHFCRKAPAGLGKVTFSSGLRAQTCGTLCSAWKHWRKSRNC